MLAGKGLIDLTVYLYSYNFTHETRQCSVEVSPPFGSGRERIRYLHYSLSTEKVYLHWVKFFIRWQAQQPGGMRHPREMGAPEVEAFLTMLATERKVSASTHN